MIVYIENLKEFTKTFLELISEFTEFEGYATHKNNHTLFTSDEHMEIEF